MEISAKHFDKICRACLFQSDNMKSLFTKVSFDTQRSLSDILAFTTDINIKFEDNLPKQVCEECITVMYKADTFKRRCLESETILNNLAENPSHSFDLGFIKKSSSLIDDTDDFKEKFTELKSQSPPHSSSTPFLDRFETKQVTESSFALVDQTELTIEVPNSSKVVKQELPITFEHPEDFSDHFADDSEFESLPIELKQETIKKESKSYTCECGTIFTAKEEHKQHATVCNKSTKCNKKIKIKCLLKCVICDSSFSTPIEYRLHQKGHDKQNELFQCSLCSRKFKRKSTLYNHIKKHEKSNEIKHTCEICKREFKYKAYLENHILTAHSRSDGFACDVCAKHFSSQEGLDIHKESHKKEKKHQCTMCSKSFLMLCTLKEHLRTHTGEKPFLCSQCGRGFSQKNNLAQHMRRHQGLKAFKCESCEKRFVSKGELEAHSRKHSGAHPFVCDDCGSGFTTSSALVKHRRIHTGERPYHCDLCPMRFAASGTLKNHRRTHTGERPFQCSYCEKAFVQRNDLISHIRCHTGERPYICTQCGQSFRKASGLKTHVKMHKESMPPPTSHSMGVVLGMHLNGQ